MRGAAYKLIFTAIAAIVVAAVFSVGAFFLMGGLVSTEVVQMTTFNVLKASDVGHLARSCLMESNDYISLEYLEELKKESRLLGEECGMSLDFGLRMEDIDTGERFTHNYYAYGGAYSQPLFVRLKVGDEMHMGEMSVSIK